VINLEAPTHRIPTDKTGRDEEAGPLLNASAPTYEKALQALDDQVPDGYRLTWIRRVAY